MGWQDFQDDYNQPDTRWHKGPLNLLTDVPGITVGHQTVRLGKVQTGVTVIQPATGNVFREKLLVLCRWKNSEHWRHRLY